MPLTITPAQYDHFWKKGWLVVEGVFKPEAVERLAQRGLELIAPEVTAETGSYKVDRSPDGKEFAPRKLDHPFQRDRLYGEVIFASPMPDLIVQLLKTEPVFHSDQLFFKPPRHGSPKAYHQDNAYFLMHPDDHVVTAWIALDDVDEENGCLRYIDESHLGPILPSVEVPGVPHDLTPDPSLYDIKKESLARVKKGGVVFHHSKALHMSGPNHSPRWRRGYATHWCSAETTGENNVLATGYFYKPEMFEGLPGKHAERHARGAAVATR
jgi:hypothetical protein